MRLIGSERWQLMVGRDILSLDLCRIWQITNRNRGIKNPRGITGLRIWCELLNSSPKTLPATSLLITHIDCRENGESQGGHCRFWNLVCFAQRHIITSSSISITVCICIIAHYDLTEAYSICYLNEIRISISDGISEEKFSIYAHIIPLMLS